MSIDSIIFDLDGTLWDSSEGVSKTWSLVLNKYDYERKDFRDFETAEWVCIRSAYL